jgi:hypothetical protein
LPARMARLGSLMDSYGSRATSGGRRSPLLPLRRRPPPLPPLSRPRSSSSNNNNNANPSKVPPRPPSPLSTPATAATTMRRPSTMGTADRRSLAWNSSETLTTLFRSWGRGTLWRVVSGMRTSMPCSRELRRTTTSSKVRFLSFFLSLLLFSQKKKRFLLIHERADYGCALQREILIQGRLYISEHHLSFYANIFGWVTSVSRSPPTPPFLLPAY